MDLPCDPVVVLLGPYPKEIDTCELIKTCTWGFSQPSVQEREAEQHRPALRGKGYAVMFYSNRGIWNAVQQ